MIIREPDKAKQLVCFDGLLLEGRNGYRNVWPTDIDGYIQLDVENLFILIELKYRPRFEGEMKYGQSNALVKLADAVGENCYVLLAEHEDTDTSKPIMVKDALVTRIYRGSMGWIDWNKTVKATVESIIKARKDVKAIWQKRR